MSDELQEWNRHFAEEANRIIARRREHNLEERAEEIMEPRVPRHLKKGGGPPAYKAVQRTIIRHLANNEIGRVWDPQRQRFTGQVKVFAEDWAKKAERAKEDMATDLSWLDSKSESRKELIPLFNAEWKLRLGVTPDIYQIVKDLERGDKEELEKQQEVMIGPRYVEEEDTDGLGESDESTEDFEAREDPEEEADEEAARPVWDFRLGKKADKDSEEEDEEEA